MTGLYERITRFFLNATDPYDLTDARPHSLVWPYLKSHFKPMRNVLIASVLLTVMAAAVEVWLIRYAGQIIDTLVASSSDNFWQTEGLGLFGAALIVLLFRPFAQFLRLSINTSPFNAISQTWLDGERMTI